MNCWHCKSELIWGGDDDIKKSHDIEESDDYSMVTNLSCPTCNSFVLVYYPKEKEK